MFKLLTCLLVAGTVLAAPGPSAKLTSHLKSVLEKSANANIIVSFVGSNKAPLEQINNAVFPDRNARLNAVHDALVAHAEKSQQGVLELLSSSVHKVFWISNQIYVKAADAALIQKIAEVDEVESVDEEIIASLIEGMDLEHVTKQEQYEWGVIKIQAPEAWAAAPNFQDGEGVVVATVDTGVRVTHEALKDNFLGDYGWWDPSTAEPLPTDRNGHGTHTTGTIAGSKGIGVAPGAKWAACRGCATSSCSQSDLLACAQFFACPTLADGTGKDCTKAPQLVSNSWGGGRGNTWYNPAIDAWHAANIIPLFSIGNSGANCNTANSPGDQHVIGVGSTTINDEISTFSSTGPTTDGRMKPEISAPGSAVVSAYNTADDAYASLSGTSMACPHAAGVIALLKGRNPALTYLEASGFLIDQADQDLASGSRTCEGVPDDVFPNHVFGNGRINALKSVTAVVNAMKN